MSDEELKAQVVLQVELAGPSSLAWCFLTSIVSVPEDILQQVAPLMLVRLLHHLNADSTAAAGSTGPASSTVSQPLPQVMLTKTEAVLTCSLRCWCVTSDTAQLMLTWLPESCLESVVDVESHHSRSTHLTLRMMCAMHQGLTWN